MKIHLKCIHTGLEARIFGKQFKIRVIQKDAVSVTLRLFQLQLKTVTLKKNTVSLIISNIIVYFFPLKMYQKKKKSSVKITQDVFLLKLQNTSKNVFFYIKNHKCSKTKKHLHACFSKQQHSSGSAFHNV